MMSSCASATRSSVGPTGVSAPCSTTRQASWRFRMRSAAMASGSWARPSSGRRRCTNFSLVIGLAQSPTAASPVVLSARLSRDCDSWSLSTSRRSTRSRWPSATAAQCVSWSLEGGALVTRVIDPLAESLRVRCSHNTRTRELSQRRNRPRATIPRRNA